MITLNHKQTGQRIAELRKFKGYSQEELAKLMDIPRSSLTQIELGNRGLDIIELQKAATALDFSIDNLTSADFNLLTTEAFPKKSAPKKPEVRVSVSKLQIEKFKQVLLYILERCAGKPNVGETVLYKLLYFSDFNYYEIYEEHLTGASYRKLERGPVPLKLNGIIDQMIAEKELQKIKTEYFGYPQIRYLPLIKANLTLLKASEKEVIDKVIDQMSDWSASTISNYSHKDMPWVAAEINEEISYELVFYREAPYSVRNYDNEIDA